MATFHQAMIRILAVAVAFLLTVASAFVLPCTPTSSSSIATTARWSAKDSIAAAFQEAALVAQAELEKLEGRLAEQDAQRSQDIEQLRAQMEQELQKQRSGFEKSQKELEAQHAKELKQAVAEAQKKSHTEVQLAQKRLQETQNELTKAQKDHKKAVTPLEVTVRELEAANLKVEQQNARIRQLEEDLVGKEEAAALEAKRVKEAQVASAEAKEAKLAQQAAFEAKEREEQARKEAEAKKRIEEEERLAEEEKRKQAKAAQEEQDAKAAKKRAAQEAVEAKKRAAQEEKKRAELEARQRRQEEAEAKRIAALEAKQAEEEAKRRKQGIPEVNDWQINAQGEVMGLVTGHPTIPDGETIKTSCLADPESAMEETVVTTSSGSKYRLGSPKGGNKVAESQPSMPQVDAQAKEREEEERKEALRMELGLTGETAGPNGKYLLAGTPTSSTNKRSWLYTAYPSDGQGMPKGNALAIKVSTNREGIERERANYLKVTGGFGNFKKGMFVTQKEFLKEVGGSLGVQKSALVMERGRQDLSKYVAEHGRLEGRELRNAASAAIQCIDALHNAGLVWTDLKTENFVVVSGEEGLLTIKGIDLESAMPAKQNPVDYSPEACPPEFALSHLVGESTDFTLQYSYDIWSLGMFLFELATGECYFAGQPSPSAIMKVLPDAEPVVDGVPDEKMADLISLCLSPDPKKRPSVAQVLLHPYFLTTGFGPFSF